MKKDHKKLIQELQSAGYTMLEIEKILQGLDDIKKMSFSLQKKYISIYF